MGLKERAQDDKSGGIGFTRGGGGGVGYHDQIAVLWNNLRIDHGQVEESILMTRSAASSRRQIAHEGS